MKTLDNSFIRIAWSINTMINIKDILQKDHYLHKYIRPYDTLIKRDLELIPDRDSPKWYSNNQEKEQT